MFLKSGCSSVPRNGGGGGGGEEDASRADGCNSGVRMKARGGGGLGVTVWWGVNSSGVFNL